MLKPDVTQDTIDSTICVSGWTATVRPPTSYTNALKVHQIAEYGYADVEEVVTAEEDLMFSLPKELRARLTADGDATRNLGGRGARPAR